MEDLPKVNVTHLPGPCNDLLEVLQFQEEYCSLEWPFPVWPKTESVDRKMWSCLTIILNHPFG
jgi:hypothetical protein